MASDGSSTRLGVRGSVGKPEVTRTGAHGAVGTNAQLSVVVDGVGMRIAGSLRYNTITGISAVKTSDNRLLCY